MAEINIPINAEISELLNKLNLIKNDIDKITAKSEEAGKTIKNSFTGNSVNNVNKELKRTNGLIEDIEETIKEWEKAKKEATKTSDIEKYNKKIAEGKKELQEYNTKGLPALKNVNAEATKGESIFKKLGTQIATAFSVYAIISFAKESVMAYNEQLKNENKLSAALGERQYLLEGLIEQSVELQKKTAISDEAILSVQSFLAVQGRTEAQIKKMTKTALDLSVVLGTDVNTAAKYLDQTFEGTIGRLGKYDERLKTLTDDQLENGEAVDLLASKYEGMAEKSVTKIDKLLIKWKEFKETIGESLYSAIFETNADLLSDANSVGIADAQKNISKLKQLWVSGGKDIQKEAKKLLESQSEDWQIASGKLASFTSKGFQQSGLSLAEYTGKVNFLTSEVTRTKKQYELLLGLTNKTEAKGIDYASMSVERLNDLLESATKSEAKLIKAEIKRKEESIKATEKFNFEVLEADNKLLQQKIDLMEDGTDKLIAEENLRYKKELATIKGSAEQIAQQKENAEKINAKNLLKIIEDAGKKKQEKIDELLNIEYLAGLDAQDKEIAEVMQKYEKLIEEAEKNGVDTTNLRNEEVNEINAIVKKGAEEEVKTNKEKNEKIIENEKKIKEIRMQMAQESADMIAGVWDNLIERNIQKEKTENEKKYSDEERRLKKQLDSKAISQEQFDKKLEELNNKKAKSNYEMALKEHRMNEKLALAKIVMDSAVQIAKIEGILAFNLSNPLTFGLAPLALAQLVAVIASATAQTAVVLSAPKPTMGEGGWINGRSHSFGGVDINAEGDEFIVRKIVAKKNARVLEELNKGNSFGALKELAQLNGISLNQNITNDIHTKEKIANNQKLSLNEIPEIREIRDFLKRENVQKTYSNGYVIEKKGNVTRKYKE